MALKSIRWIFWAGLLLGCNKFAGHQVEAKNACIEKKLQALRTTPVYAAITRAFNDTFPTLKANPVNFGHPDYSDCRVDEAVFLNASGDRCLLLVSTRYTDGLGFGGTRVVKGHNSVHGWKFAPDRQFEYDNSFNRKFEANQFQYIDMLGRYFVVISGSPRGFGCDIDESYWFKPDAAPANMSKELRKLEDLR